MCQLTYTKFLEQVQRIRIYDIDSTKNNVRSAYDVYQKAVNGEKPFCIIGRKEKKDKNGNEIGLNACLSVVEIGTDTKEKIFDVYKHPEKTNFKYGNSSQEGHFLNDTNWSLLMNDAWILGGIEAGKTFYFAQKDGFSKFKDVEDLLESDNPKYPISVTARELIGLRCYGYEPVLKDKILIFSPPRNIELTDLEKYHNATCNMMKDASGKDNFEVCRETFKSWLGSFFSKS